MFPPGPSPSINKPMSHMPTTHVGFIWVNRSHNLCRTYSRNTCLVVTACQLHQLNIKIRMWPRLSYVCHIGWITFSFPMALIRWLLVSHRLSAWILCDGVYHHFFYCRILWQPNELDKHNNECNTHKRVCLLYSIQNNPPKWRITSTNPPGIMIVEFFPEKHLLAMENT